MSGKKPVIGVLALQGAVDLHKPHIEAAGGEFMAVKTQTEFDSVDGFILPGGESTTMLKLIDNFGLWESLEHNFRKKPVWGICAGAILMADKVLNPSQKSFGLISVAVNRNGYGRQLDSHVAEIGGYSVSFIRAPIISQVENGVDVLAIHQNAPVWVRAGKVMATTFHPELTLQFPSPMHRKFMEFFPVSG